MAIARAHMRVASRGERRRSMIWQKRTRCAGDGGWKGEALSHIGVASGACGRRGPLVVALGRLSLGEPILEALVLRLGACCALRRLPLGRRATRRCLSRSWGCAVANTRALIRGCVYLCMLYACAHLCVYVCMRGCVALACCHSCLSRFWFQRFVPSASSRRQEVLHR